MSEDRAHALLSASSSKQWLICTPSARLSEQFPDTTSVHAAEGSLAHDIAELKLRKQFVEPMPTKVFNSQLKKLKERQFEGKPLYQEEMLKHTDTYKDYVSAIVHAMATPPYVAIEKRLNYSAYAPEGFGTGDCIIIGGNTLYITDFKYGTGVAVEAEGNTQMMLYALGAYSSYGFLFPIETVQMAIIQPRLGGITEASVSISELLAWGDSIKPIAQQAFEGTGELVMGDHCKFCRAKALCPLQLAAFNEVSKDYSLLKPPLITNAQVGEALARVKNFASWVKALNEYALKETLKGNEILGWKAVEGRSSRQYTDLDAAFKFLVASGVEEVLLYNREPLTPPAAEELLGAKKYKELLEGFVIKKPGAPTLAMVDDKREAIKRISAEDDFSQTKGETTNE